MNDNNVEKAKIIASNLEWAFNHTNLTKEDYDNFHRDCREAGVSSLDVYQYMNDYETI